MRQLFIFTALLSWVLLVNFSIISFNLMYPEQPLIYRANQELHSLMDLLAVYAHPRMFHVSILFFRPSGHFLMYQLLAPLLGWHNTQGFIVVNLLFLALTGYGMVRLYSVLFPGYWLGGYFAFGLYLMHPALMLSRLIVLHFEFAHVFFVVWSLYSFAIYIDSLKTPSRGRPWALAGALLLYAIAATFKEAAVLLGPVLIGYAGLAWYKESLPSRGQKAKIIALILCVTVSVALYLSMQWPVLHHPLRNHINLAAIREALHKYFLLTIGAKGDFFSPPVWRNVVFPLSSRLLIGGFLWALVGASILLFRNKGARRDYKKSFLFLGLSVLLFFILPLCWAWGLPWHLNLSLVFLSLMMGFSTEYLAYQFLWRRAVLVVMVAVIFLLLGWSAIAVNRSNIHYYEQHQGLALAVGRNAVLHPPLLDSPLRANSIVVVEDSQLHDAYLLGASIYPFFSVVLHNPNIDGKQPEFSAVEDALFLKQQPIYNGNLFAWAYLQPSLREEVVPFHLAQMEQVPNNIVYHWLRHQAQIVCLGYDDQGMWHDRTRLFKQQLGREEKRRQLQVYPYTLKPRIAIGGSVASSTVLNFPEPQLCQLSCDQDPQCKAFTYVDVAVEQQRLRQCLFYNKVSAKKNQACGVCTGFVKTSALHHKNDVVALIKR